MISRRRFLGAAAAIGLSTLACGRPRTSGGDGVDGGVGADGGDEHRPAGLRARPRPPAPGPPPVGMHPLGIGGSGRDGLVYAPAAVADARPLPLLVALHGAGGDARGGLAPLLGLAEGAGLLLVAPESRGRTWDVLLGGYGPDVEFVDRALEQTFTRYAVDPARVLIEGFSDGASYALSLGLSNGDLFTAVIAFSPGFIAPADRRGSPRVFVSHGKADPVLPVGSTSRTIVPRLLGEGHEVRYLEFNGGHSVPPNIARQAVEWSLGTG